MTVPTPDLLRARAEAAVARARLMRTVGEAQHRLAPATIARNAWDDVRGKGEVIAGQTMDLAREKGGQTIELAREKPAAAGVTIGLLGVFIVRKPIGRVLRRLFRRKPRRIAKADVPYEPLISIAARAGD